MKLFYIYLIIINALGLLIMLIDKYNAINGLHRIPERGLFAASLLGGSLGTWLGMLLFRHKTQKPKFTVGFPMILCLHIGLILLYLLNKSGRFLF